MSAFGDDVKKLREVAAQQGEMHKAVQDRDETIGGERTTLHNPVGAGGGVILTAAEYGKQIAVAASSGCLRRLRSDLLESDGSLGRRKAAIPLHETLNSILVGAQFNRGYTVRSAVLLDDYNGTGNVGYRGGLKVICPYSFSRYRCMSVNATCDQVFSGGMQHSRERAPRHVLLVQSIVYTRLVF